MWFTLQGSGFRLGTNINKVALANLQTSFISYKYTVEVSLQTGKSMFISLSFNFLIVLAIISAVIAGFLLTLLQLWRKYSDKIRWIKKANP